MPTAVTAAAAPTFGCRAIHSDSFLSTVRASAAADAWAARRAARAYRGHIPEKQQELECLNDDSGSGGSISRWSIAADVPEWVSQTSNVTMTPHIYSHAVASCKC
jgi:hypothetical protein